MQNLEKIWSVAVQTNSNDLKSICTLFMSDNLQEVIGTNIVPFLHLTDLLRVLRDSQKDTWKFQAACAWIQQYELHERLQYTDRIFALINFKKIPQPVIFHQVAVGATEEIRQANIWL